MKKLVIKQKPWVKTTSITSALLFFLVGCAASSKSIQPAYTPSLKYQNYTCNQLQEEYERVGKKLAVLIRKQDKASTIDAISMGVGLVLFLPVLLIATTGDSEIELAQLKGEYETIEIEATKRVGCGFSTDTNASREK